MNLTDKIACWSLIAIVILSLICIIRGPQEIKEQVDYSGSAQFMESR